MKTDEQIKDELKRIDTHVIQSVCNILRQYNKETRDYLADVVAAVCDVTLEDLMTDTKHLHNSHARWFFWYAYRYMTNESYSSIAKRTSSWRKFTESCVGICVGKMSMMIDNEPIWKKRWVIVKRIIKQSYNLIEDEAQEPIKIIVPQNANVELKRE